MADLCNNHTDLCQTISEYSRQCVHAGGKPAQWRNATFCCKLANTLCVLTYLLVIHCRHNLQCFCLFVVHQQCLSPQTWNVHTTWSTWSMAAHVLTAAPPLMPARRVTATTTQAATALPVSTRLYLHHSVDAICKHTQARSCLMTVLIVISPSSSGTVLDDISNTGCVALDQCPCLHNGKVYQSGKSYSYSCRSW